MLGRPFEEALLYVAHVHGGQVRKGTSIPYLGHLLSVTALVLEDGGDEEEAIAALLHDAPEDQGGLPRLDDIRARFGARVARIVEGCTDTFEQPKPPWCPRKKEYLSHLEDAPIDVLRVSLADKVDNARAIARDYRLLGERLWERFNPDSDQRWYYTSLLDVFRRRYESSLVGELERAVEQFAPQRAVRGVAATKDLCRGWSEDDIVQSIVNATQFQRSILRSIAQNFGTDVIQIAEDIGAKNHRAVSGGLGSWYQNTTRPMGIKDPATGEDSWPMYVPRFTRNGQSLWRYEMPPAVARIVLAHT